MSRRPCGPEWALRSGGLGPPVPTVEAEEGQKAASTERALYTCAPGCCSRDFFAYIERGPGDRQRKRWTSNEEKNKNPSTLTARPATTLASRNKMKQWVTNQDGLDKVKLVEAPMPEDPKEGEVLVKINSVSLNFRDTEGDLRPPHGRLRKRRTG